MSVVNPPTVALAVKEQVRAVLDQLPDDCTMDEVQYRLYVTETVHQRIQALDAGAPVVSQAEAERRIEKWLK